MATDDLRAPRSGNTGGGTRSELVTAAIRSLSEVGFAGASAREIAGRAGVNQALVFYHFGSVAGLLLAAFDHVTDLRLATYRKVVADATSLVGLLDAAESAFEADLDAGYVAVLVEMLSGARTDASLAADVQRRLDPWIEVAAEAIRRIGALLPLPMPLPTADLAHVLVAGFVGLELLADAGGRKDATRTLFARARTWAGLADAAATPRRLLGWGRRRARP